jgi:hypothetical protein
LLFIFNTSYPINKTRNIISTNLLKSEVIGLKVHIQNQEIEIKNEQSDVDLLFNQINETLKKSGLYLSHMNIDGMEVYDDYYEYILDKLDEIKTINIEMITLRQWIDNMMVSMKDYVDRIVPETSRLSDQFYQNQTTAWGDFVQLMEGLQWVTSTLNVIDSLSKEKPIYVNWNDFLQLFTSIQQELKDLEEAVNNKDTVLIGDILEYEVTPLLENLQKTVNNTIDNEVKRHDLN